MNKQQLNDISLQKIWIGELKDIDFLVYGHEFTVFNDVEHFFSGFEAQSHFPLIVFADNIVNQGEALKKIRKHELLWQSCILVNTPCYLSEALANGLFNKQSDDFYNSVITRATSLNLSLNLVDSALTKLLSFMWIYKGNSLLPVHDLSINSVYYYPLLECFGVNTKDAMSWLSSIHRRKLLQTDKLIDRVRYCRHCQSGHLNYVDSCPSCQSIDIASVSSLHCFNCGHVNGESKFKEGIGLSCPNCHTKLRHIGVDYDRPIENQKCNQCHTSFVDADVIAKCFHCQTSNQVDELIVQNIHSYNISMEGKSLIRLGERFDNFNLTSTDSINYSHFEWVVKWQNQLAVRHQQIHSIVKIELKNLAQFIAENGEARAIQLIDEFESRINESIRTTDICCLAGEHTLLLMLPNTTIEHLSFVYQKLKGISLLNKNSDFSLSIKGIPLPSKEMPDEIGVWLEQQFAAQQESVL